jgi:hypothetical protein
MSASRQMKNKIYFVQFHCFLKIDNLLESMHVYKSLHLEFTIKTSVAYSFVA